jgi:hypothetical protein
MIDTDKALRRVVLAITFPAGNHTTASDIFNALDDMRYLDDTSVIAISDTIIPNYAKTDNIENES